MWSCYRCGRMGVPAKGHSVCEDCVKALEAPALPPRLSVAQEGEGSLFRKLFKPVTYAVEESDSLEMRMLKKIHNITAQHLPNYSPLTPTEIRAIHSAAFAGIDGPEPDEPNYEEEPATPPPALQTCTEPFSQGAGLRQKVQDLADQWLDPEFWKDTGNLMDSRDCAGYLIGILRELDEAEPLALASLINRLENDYAFECPGGPLRNCVEWQQLVAELEKRS